MNKKLLLEVHFEKADLGIIRKLKQVYPLYNILKKERVNYTLYLNKDEIKKSAEQEAKM